MKVFVTGATGFIGKHLVKRLVSEGHTVCCLVRRSSHSDFLQALGAERVYGDVNDQSALSVGMAGCDWLFHLANLYSMWEPDPSRFERVNVDGTRQVMAAALECGLQKVVYVSTVAVYGQPAAVPFREDDLPGPVWFSEYGRTKAAADRIVWDFYYQQHLPLVVIYPGIVLGAGDDKASGHYIQDIIRRRVPSTIFHDSWATYVYVGDVIDALLRAVQLPAASGQKYFIGNQSMNGRDYARLISQVSGVALPLFRFPDWMVMSAAYLLTWLSAVIQRPPLWGLSVDAAHTLQSGFRCDGSKAERELGIHYTDIRLALEEAVNSYRAEWKGRRSHHSGG